jgi:glucan 1,3-beta-glucosidase
LQPLAPDNPEGVTTPGPCELSTLRTFLSTLQDSIPFSTTTTLLSAPVAGTDNCQNNIFSLEGTLININVYCLDTVGVINVIPEAGNSLALYSDNENVYPGVITLFQLASGSGGGPPPPSIIMSSVPTTMSTVVSKTTTSQGSGSTGWIFLGCYTDNVGGRTLMNGLKVPGGPSAMTIELCEPTCNAAGYILAGVEYSGECCKCTQLL